MLTSYRFKRMATLYEVGNSVSTKELIHAEY